MSNFLRAGFTVAVMLMFADATGARQTGSRDASVGRAAFETSVRARVSDRRAKCMNAIGHSAFCDCLSGSLPLDVDFQRRDSRYPTRAEPRGGGSRQRCHLNA